MENDEPSPRNLAILEWQLERVEPETYDKTLVLNAKTKINLEALD